MDEIIQEIFIYTYLCALFFIPLLLAIIPVIREYIRKKNKQKSRIKALANVRLYMQPYEDIWKYQVISNTLLKIELKYLIIYFEGSGMNCKFMCNKKENIDLLWDFILYKFNSSTNYHDLLQEFMKYADLQNISYTKTEKEVKLKLKLDDMVDVNNCSEIELTKLKGINIAIAKRIVIQRDAHKGFKTKEEFLKFINLKPHQEKMIKDYVKIRKPKVIKTKRKYFERRVDI